MTTLFEPGALGALQLQNRIVMAPMTRSRAAAGDLATDLMAEYYSQRASAGMIISEGLHPSADGKGYCRTPGMFNEEQAQSWRKVADAVHAKGASFVAQLMHVGRAASALNKDPTAETVSASAIQANAKVFTDAVGMAAMEMPRALRLDEIPLVIAEFATSAKLARQAGFDGVELHCTSGYLPMQFLSTGTNHRTDAYGGSVENRIRFVVETLEALAAEIGADRVGFRICPGNPFNDVHDEDPLATYSALLDAVNGLGLAYVHLIDMRSETLDVRAMVAKHWSGPVILNESITPDEAKVLLAEGAADAISFGRAFISNPDLVNRIRIEAPLAPMGDLNTIYTEGPQGYTDYPEYAG